MKMHDLGGERERGGGRVVMVPNRVWLVAHRGSLPVKAAWMLCRSYVDAM